MKRLDGYFNKFTDSIGYINLKEDSPHKKLKDLPLPIYMDDMKEGIKSGDLGSEISLELILTGMLVNIAIDSDFIHRDSYEEILKDYLEDVAGFTKDKAIRFDGEDNKKAILLARAGYLINPDDIQNAYVYARFLWPLAYKEEDEYKDEFVKEALRIFQEIIGKDEDFALAYYELGNIYANLGEYIKARSYYENAQKRVEEDYAKEEINNRIAAIEDNADIEGALYYIGKGNYARAIEDLTKLLTRVKRADAYYYLPVAYQNLGQYDNSIMAFENSLDLDGDFRELYNDYAISLYLNKDELKALEIINRGLKKYPQDPRMTYNKVQINLVLGNTSQAKKDIEELLSYDDLTDEIRENLRILKDHYKLD